VKRFIAPFVGLSIVSSFYGASASAQSLDVVSLIKARQLAEQNGTLPPAAIIPDTVPYIYVVTNETTSEEYGTVVFSYEMNPMAAPGARINLLTGTMEGLSKDSRKELERYNDEMSTAEIAEEFWCDDNDEEEAFDEDFDVSKLTVISENEASAHVSFGGELLAELLDDDNDMPKKIRKNLAVDAELSKPDLKMLNMQMRLTKPVTLKIVAKIKEMEIGMSCKYAPNGLLYFHQKIARVRGKALGSSFSENIILTVSELQPIEKAP